MRLGSGQWEREDATIAPRGDRSLLRLHLAALYRLHANDRLHAVNDAGALPAPRLHVVRGLRETLVRFGGGVPIKTVAELRALLAAEPVGAALDGTPPLTAERVRAVLAADRPLGAEWRGPAFAFPANISGLTLGEEARVVLVDASNAGIAGSFGLAAADFPLALPCTTVLHRGEAAAVCHAARRTATAAEAGVRTLPGFRGRGFGAAAVAAWAGEARRLGLVPLYSCAWENAASRGVARRLGLRLYAEDWHIA